MHARTPAVLLGSFYAVLACVNGNVKVYQLSAIEKCTTLAGWDRSVGSFGERITSFVGELPAEGV